MNVRTIFLVMLFIVGCDIFKTFSRVAISSGNEFMLILADLSLVVWVLIFFILSIKRK